MAESGEKVARHCNDPQCAAGILKDDFREAKESLNRLTAVVSDIRIFTNRLELLEGSLAVSRDQANKEHDLLFSLVRKLEETKANKADCKEYRESIGGSMNEIKDNVGEAHKEGMQYGWEAFKILLQSGLTVLGMLGVLKAIGH